VIVMPESLGAHHRRTQYARWARLLDSILTPTDESRLVPVAEVGDGNLGAVEERLAALGVSPTVSEEHSATGPSRFRVLVPAQSAPAVAAAIAELRAGTGADG
jgi:hypothetical protein